MKQSQREAMSNCVWNSAAEQRREENVASFTFVHACRLVEEAEPDHLVVVHLDPLLLPSSLIALALITFLFLSVSLS